MSAIRDRINVKEYSVMPAFYGSYLAAQENGKLALNGFWSLMRYQLKSHQMENSLEPAYNRLCQHIMQTRSSAQVSLRLSFSYGDQATRDLFDALAQRFGLTKTDTVKLVLLASELHAGAHCSASAAHRRDASTTVDALEAPCHPIVGHAMAASAAAPSKTKLCEKTNVWLIFKEARSDAAMTNDQLLQARLTGGLFSPMTADELHAHGLANPAPATTPPAVEVAPNNVIAMIERSTASGAVGGDGASKSTSKAAQAALANSIFAAADFLIEAAA